MGEERKGSYGYRKDELATRLNRIEGQVRGISKMVAEEKYCVDILTQISAVQAALERVSLGVLQDHMKGCVLDAASPQHSEHGVEELMGVLERYVALRR